MADSEGDLAVICKHQQTDRQTEEVRGHREGVDVITRVKMQHRFNFLSAFYCQKISIHVFSCVHLMTVNTKFSLLFKIKALNDK